MLKSFRQIASTEVSFFLPPKINSNSNIGSRCSPYRCWSNLRWLLPSRCIQVRWLRILQEASRRLRRSRKRKGQQNRYLPRFISSRWVLCWHCPLSIRSYPYSFSFKPTIRIRFSFWIHQDCWSRRCWCLIRRFRSNLLQANSIHHG